MHSLPFLTANKIHTAKHAITDKEEIWFFSANLDRVCSLARQDVADKKKNRILNKAEYQSGWDRLLADFFGLARDSTGSGSEK